MRETLSYIVCFSWRMQRWIIMNTDSFLKWHQSSATIINHNFFLVSIMTSRDPSLDVTFIRTRSDYCCVPWQISRHHHHFRWLWLRAKKIHLKIKCNQHKKVSEFCNNSTVTQYILITIIIMMYKRQHALERDEREIHYGLKTKFISIHPYIASCTIILKKLKMNVSYSWLTKWESTAALNER